MMEFPYTKKRKKEKEKNRGSKYLLKALRQCVQCCCSVFQVADFGLVHASKDGSICFEPVNTDIRGTPGQGKAI